MYNAFISYSHAADGQLAPALQSGLQRFAKPWYQLRALHIFRDQTNLSLNPSLWSSIQTALDRSDWFIVLASPEAAASKWVDREIEYWLTRHPVERILIVLTEGTMTWDASQRAFDARTSSAVPPQLMHAFADEPLYLDLVWAHNETDLSLSHPRFREAVAGIASAPSGRPKDEMIGEDVRQHQRVRRLTRSAIVALSVLTISSIMAAGVAVRERDIAEAQRARAVQENRVATARQLAAQSKSIMARYADQLPLAVLLAPRICADPTHGRRQSGIARYAGAAAMPRVLIPVRRTRCETGAGPGFQQRWKIARSSTRRWHLRVEGDPRR